MATLLNNFSGGTNGTTVTTGNTGGASGNAFDAVGAGATGSTEIFDNSHPLHGESLAFKWQSSTTVAAVGVQWSTSMGSQSTVFGRIYIYNGWTQAPAASVRMLSLVTSGGFSLCSGLYMLTTGKLTLTDTGSANGVTTTNKLPLNSWCRVEFQVTTSTTAGVVRLQLFLNPDSTTPDEDLTATSQNTSAGPIAICDFGQGFDAQASIGPFWYTDIGLSTTGFLGPSVTSSPPIQPQTGGKTWQRRYRRRQILIAPSAASLDVTGAGAVTAKKPTASGAGVEEFSGSGNASAKKLIASGSGTEVFSGSGTALAKKPTASSTGSETFTGTGAPSAKKPTASGTGSTPLVITGSGGITAKKPTVAGSGTEIFVASGSAALKKPSAHGTGTTFYGSGVITAKKPSASGTGSETFTATGTVLAKKPIASGAGTNTPPGISGSGAVTAKKPSASGTGITLYGSGGITAKKPSASGTGTETFTGSGSAARRKPAASGTGTTFYGSGSASAKKPGASGSGSETFTATGAVQLKKPGASGSGAYNSAAGTGGISAKKPAAHGTGTLAYAGIGAVQLKKPASHGTGTQSLTLTGSGGLLLKKLVISGISISYGTSVASGKPLNLITVGAGTAPDTDTSEGRTAKTTISGRPLG